MASSQTETLIAGGVAFATIGGVLMGVGATENADSHHTVWTNAWFVVGCVLVAFGAALVLGTLLTPWLRARQRQRQTATPSERELGEGLGALTPEYTPPPSSPLQPPSPSPLQLTLVNESWRLFRGRMWLVALSVRVANFTDKPITLTHYFLWKRYGLIEDDGKPPLPDEVWRGIRPAIEAAQRQLAKKHASELFDGEITVPPHGSLTRWHIDTALVPMPERGRPRCTFVIRDSLDNRYELSIPARPAETYQSQ